MKDLAWNSELAISSYQWYIFIFGSVKYWQLFYSFLCGKIKAEKMKAVHSEYCSNHPKAVCILESYKYV
jgi:hypothetical protein